VTRRGTRRERTGGTDAIGIVGWLYADLFLLLFVVGLAMSVLLKDADAIVPTITTTTTTLPEASSESTTTTTTLPCQLLVTANSGSSDFKEGIYVEIDSNLRGEDLENSFIEQLSREIVDYPEIANVDPRSVPFGFVLVYGGNDTGQQIIDGIGHAIGYEVVDRVEEAIPENFRNGESGPRTPFRVLGTTRIPLGQVGFDIYPLVGTNC
jgi:hypothetical protein